MTNEQKVFFRNQFRDARYKALKDAEDFESIFHSIESIGAFLTDNSKHTSLGAYKPILQDFSADSTLAKALPKEFPSYHNSFLFLYEIVRKFRNEVAHQGVYARTKTRYAIELGLIFEQKLNSMDDNITNYMVRNPTTASLWEPLSHIRKEMLVNSFSHIPVFYNNEWKLVSDYHLNSFLRSYSGDHQEGLRLSLQTGIQSGLNLEQPARIVEEDYSVERLELTSTKPVLIMTKSVSNRLIGLLTSFDLL